MGSKPAKESKPPPPKKRCNMVQSLEDLKSPLFWRAVAAEMIGTMLLVFLGCGSTTGWGDGYAPSVVQIAFAFGLTLAVLIWALGGCSGCHVNPAVTMPMVITRKISIVKGLLYIIAQCLGGIIAAALLKGLTPAANQGTLGASSLAPDMTPAQGFGVEFMLTFVLVLAVFSMVDEKRNQSVSAPLGIGFAAVTTHLMGIRYTGCNMNPARSFGPSLISGFWKDHWVYWCGPLLGGIVAGLVYDNIFAANASKQKTRDYMLAADYDNKRYAERKDRYITVADKVEEDIEEAI